MSEVTRADYGQFLLVSQINYTLTYFAEHSGGFSHDAVTRYLQGDKLRPRSVWEAAKGDLILSAEGWLSFDDSVLDKNHSRQIALVRRQYSGNEHRVIRGIGLISCVYVNPELKRYWVIDYRLYDPQGDGKSKHQHVAEMYEQCVQRQGCGELSFKGVLMDIWYATTKFMLSIHRSGRLFYCPIKANRRMSELQMPYCYQAAGELSWHEAELRAGKRVHLHSFPQALNLKLFRIALSSEDTELVVTNDEAPLDVQAVRMAQGWRWKVEQFHRELKQTTGIEACQCRTQRAQRNHIGCALLVWLSLARHAQRLSSNVYALKRSLLDPYIRQQLRQPSLSFA